MDERLALANPNNFDSIDMIDRNVVKHNYHDYSNEPLTKDNSVSRPDQSPLLQQLSRQNSKNATSLKGGAAVPFPVKLHAMLDQIEEDGLATVMSWQPHGRCFVVHDQNKFVENVMPTYFRQSKFPSFQRQLNLYGFQRLTSGRDKGGYYHELFLRGKRFLANRIQRMKVKGTGVRKAASPETEPQFYDMKPVGVDLMAMTRQSTHHTKMTSHDHLSSSAKAVRQAILRNALIRLKQHQQELKNREVYQSEARQRQKLWQNRKCNYPSSGTFIVDSYTGSDSDRISSISDDDEDDEKEFSAILSSLVQMPAEQSEKRHHPLADNDTLGNLFEMLTK